MTSATPSVGVVTIAHGRHDHLGAQLRTLAAGTRHPDLYVVVAMDDPEIVATQRGGLAYDVVRYDGRAAAGLPLAGARNLGVATLLAAGVDVVVLLDVDCLAGPGLVASYAATVAERPDILWSGPVTYLPPPPAGGYDLSDLDVLATWDDPHPARPAPGPGELLLPAQPDLFWSLSCAVGAATWQRIGGFDEAYTGYGAEDTDFGHRAAARGVELGWVGGARAYHQHHPVSRPPIEHVDSILRNARIFHDRWGWWPMLGWLEAFEEMGLVRRDERDWVRLDRAAPG